MLITGIYDNGNFQIIIRNITSEILLAFKRKVYDIRSPHWKLETVEIHFKFPIKNLTLKISCSDILL